MIQAPATTTAHLANGANLYVHTYRGVEVYFNSVWNEFRFTVDGVTYGPNEFRTVEQAEAKIRELRPGGIRGAFATLASALR